MLFDPARDVHRCVIGATSGAPVVIDDPQFMRDGGRSERVTELLSATPLGDDPFAIRTHAVAVRRALERAGSVNAAPSNARPVSLTVNSRKVVGVTTPRTHLADFLREQQRLTGTHLGCEHGVCGACTVLLDGEPVRSCITYAVACEGRSVTTVEGLADDEIAAALREAFSAAHGLQCGFCTPGMLISAWDLVQRLPDADDARIRLEMSGNLCRCTGYVGIVEAIGVCSTTARDSVS